MMEEPNWQRIRGVVEEIDLLRAQGRWTREEYLRLAREMEVAAAGFGEVMELIIGEAEPEWLGIEP